MKLVLVLFALLMGEGFAAILSPADPFLQKKSDESLHRRDARSDGVNFCPICDSLMEQGIQQLLNIILNVGVVGGCTDLCGKAFPKGNVETAACEIVCSIVGIKLFVAAIDKADLDPIYFCELVDLCPINDHGDAKILSLTISPTPVPQGTKATITVSFITKNGTGTGQEFLDILTQDHFPVEGAFLQEAQDPGTYTTAVTLDTTPCDISQEPCEQWLPGNYTLTLSLCNGECGSKHPHSGLYDSATIVFNVTT